MTKIRVIATLLFRGINLVKGRGFDDGRTVGTPLQAINVFNLREVDELLLLDVGASRAGRAPDIVEVETWSQECFVPLSVGGGITNLSQIEALLRAGADKVVINSGAYIHKRLIREASESFGAQCITAGIDFRRNAAGDFVCWRQCGQIDTGRSIAEHARHLEQSGAGEILLTSISRDGTLEGYELDAVQTVADAVTIPVIAAGGAQSYADMFEAIRRGASAVSAGALYQFTQATPKEAKQYLRAQGIPVRLPRHMVPA
jgi:imidazole glycerol-phosphate synthase subunit HisF